MRTRMAAPPKRLVLRPADGPLHRDDTIVESNSGDSAGHAIRPDLHCHDVVPYAEAFREFCFHHSDAIAPKSDSSYEQGYSAALWVAVDYLLARGLLQRGSLDAPPLDYDSMDDFIVEDSPRPEEPCYHKGCSECDVCGDLLTAEVRRRGEMTPPEQITQHAPSPPPSPKKKKRKAPFNLLAGHPSAVKIDWSED